MHRLHRQCRLRCPRAPALPAALRSAPVRTPLPTADASGRLLCTTPCNSFAPTAQSPLGLTAECTTASAPRSPGTRKSRMNDALRRFESSHPTQPAVCRFPVCVRLRSLARLEPLTPWKPHGKDVFFSKHGRVSGVCRSDDRLAISTAWRTASPVEPPSLALDFELAQHPPQPAELLLRQKPFATPFPVLLHEPARGSLPSGAKPQASAMTKSRERVSTTWFAIVGVLWRR